MLRNFKSALLAAAIVGGSGASYSYAAGNSPAYFESLFRYDKVITANVPVTTDEWNVVQLKLKAPSNIASPSNAVFRLSNGTIADFHYSGYKDGAHEYLVAIPKRFSGNVDIGAYTDLRGTYSNSHHKSRDQLLKNTVVLGSNDIMLVVDTSGSMNQFDRMSTAQMVVNQIGPELEAAGNNVGVISYSGASSYDLSLDERFHPLWFSAGGGTGTSPAISKAISYLEPRKSAGKIIIVVTDGAPNSPSATKTQIDRVVAMKDQGWAIAGLGMGTSFTDYPINQMVPNGSSSVNLSSTILDLIKTAEESIRDVNAICSGDKCAPIRNDMVAPTVDLTYASTCSVPTGEGDLRFEIKDNLAGVSSETVSFKINVNGQYVNLPVTKAYEASRSDGLSPLRVMYSVNASAVASNASLSQFMDKTFRTTYNNGGQRPFTIAVTGQDADGNTLNQNLRVDPRINDTTAPTVVLRTGNDDDKLRHTGDLYFSASDDMVGIDPSTDVALSFSYNGKTAQVDLSNFQGDSLYGNSCFARKPINITAELTKGPQRSPEVMSILADAFSDGGEIEVEAVVHDWVGNSASKQLKVHFSPETIQTQKMNAPGLTHQFYPDSYSSPYGLTIESDDLIQEVTVQNVGFYARMLKDTDTPVKLNGVDLSRDEVKFLGNFDLTEASIHFNLASVVDNANGKGSIILTPDTPGVRSINIPTELWMPDISVDVSHDAKPIQLFDYTSVTLEQSNPVACVTTNNDLSAENADNIHNPVCIVEWTKLPKDMFVDSGRSPASSSGYLSEIGIQEYEFKVLLVDKNGQRHQIDQQSGEVDVQPAADYMSFGFKNLDHTYRVITQVRDSLTQLEGPGCSFVTVSKEELLDQTMISSPGCLIEFNYIPNGMTQPEFRTIPTLEGRFDILEGDALVRWTLSSYSKSGDLIEIETEEQIIPLDNPPAPVVTISPENELEEDLYTVDRSGGLVAYFDVAAGNADIEVEVYEDGVMTESNTLFSTYGRDVEYSRPLFIDAKNLWDKVNLEIKAKYALIPDLSGTDKASVIAIPDESIAPEVAVSADEVFNTDGLSVKTKIANPFGKDSTYNPEEWGEWSVRLVNYISYSNQAELAPFKDTDANGENEFSFSLLDLEESSIRVSAEAELKSPHPEYSRTAQSRRPVFVTVLRGQAIESSLSGKRLKGEAPLPVVIKLDVENILDYRAIGKIEWQVRKKGESEWNKVESNSPVFDRFYHFFDVGEYELRATVENKHTKATFITESLHIFAYSVPEVRISGPTNAFIGSTAKLKVDPTLQDRTELKEEEILIEWSEDGGETWTPGGMEYVVSRDTEEAVMIEARVRMKNSPDEWEDAFDSAKARVSFRPVREPRSGFYGPRVIEKGFDVEWQGVVSTPYPNMDVEVKGRFIFPDGTIIDEDKVTYSATEEDFLKERIDVTYEAWIVGFKDQGAISKTTRTISVWRYDWPDWKFYNRTTADQAPADVTLMVYNPEGSTRYIEDLTLEWSIPEEATILRDTSDETRVISFSEPGEYPVTIKISDSRGNYSEITQHIVLSEADDWAIEMRLMPGNRYYNAPLDLRVMPRISGGHPRDNLSGYKYSVDGVPVTEDRYANMVFEDPGTYEITLEIDSRHGKTASKTIPLEVLKNKPPVCDLEHSSSRSRHQFRMNCTDNDGRVYGYAWTKDGEEVSVRGSRLSFNNRDESSFTITAVGIDNGGLESEPITFTYIPEVVVIEDEDDTGER